MKPSPRIEKLLAPFQEIIRTRPYFVFDRRLLIRHASTIFQDLAGYSMDDLMGKPATTIVRNGIGRTLGDVRSFLLGRHSREKNSMQFIIRANEKSRNSSFSVPPDECGGLPANVQVCRLDKTHLLAIISIIYGRVYRQMGRVSSDVMVTVDEKFRIVSFNEVFFWLANQLPRQIFNKPLQDYFRNDVSGAFTMLERKKYRKLGRTLRAGAGSWKPLFKGVPRAGSDSEWRVDANLAIAQAPDGAFCTSTSRETFLTWREPVGRGDVRMEMKVSYSSSSAYGFYFNCSDSHTDATITTPDISGYLLCLLSDYFGDQRIVLKRWGKDLAGVPVAGALKAGECTLVAEKYGGFFRFFINGALSLEYMDPQYEQYAQADHCGILFAMLPVTLCMVSLWQRPAMAGLPKPSAGQNDFVFLRNPENIFEAEICQRQVNKTLVWDLYLRRVTELRKTQKARELLVRQQAATLKQIDQELKVAATVLNRLLPRDLPEINGVKFESYFLPSGHVGGDLYDIFQVTEDKVAVLMYDVSGHGVPAALISVMFKTLFQKYFNASLSLKDQLMLMNRELCSTIGESGADMGSMMFVTVFFGLLDLRQRTLTYIGAGMPSPMVVKRAGLSLLHTKGTPLGMYEELNSKEYSVPLEKGEKLILFTDGLIEIFSPDGILYDKDKMADLIHKDRNLPLSGLIKNILNEHTQYMGGTLPRDDVTLLGIELQR